MAPVGDDTVMEPVGVAQVGCDVTEATGAGSVGMALIETVAGSDTQPVVLFLTVILCGPSVNPLNDVPGWKAAPALYS